MVSGGRVPPHLGDAAMLRSALEQQLSSQTPWWLLKDAVGTLLPQVDSGPRNSSFPATQTQQVHADPPRGVSVPFP